MALSLEGDQAYAGALLKEAGGHRWQRIPPTERKGRVHTSTVTVAAFELVEPKRFLLRDDEIEVFTTKDSGPGGQHRNKRETAVIMRHIATGIEAKAAARSQHLNKVHARQVLEARVAEHYMGAEAARMAGDRRAQVGSGMRGDKVRTYRVRDNVVTDHRTQRKASLEAILAGELWRLY